MTPLTIPYPSILTHQPIISSWFIESPLCKRGNYSCHLWALDPCRNCPFNLLHFSIYGQFFWRVFWKNLEKHQPKGFPMFKRWFTHPQYPSCWRQGPHKSQPTVEINKWLWEEMSPVSSSTALLNWSIIINHIDDVQWPSSVIIHLNPAFFLCNSDCLLNKFHSTCCRGPNLERTLRSLGPRWNTWVACERIARRKLIPDPPEFFKTSMHFKAQWKHWTRQHSEKMWAEKNTCNEKPYWPGGYTPVIELGKRCGSLCAPFDPKGPSYLHKTGAFYR